MKESAAIGAVVLALLAVGVGDSAQAANPRQAIWLNYQGHLYSSDLRRTTAGAMLDEGHGYIPAFSLRLRGAQGDAAEAEMVLSSPGRETPVPQVRLISLEDDRPTPRSSASQIDGPTLILRFAYLDLPEASGETSSFYRRGIAEGLWPWMAAASQNARDVGLEIDLRESGNNRAAALCRHVPVEPLANAASDRCTIEGLVDRTSGWALVARISRTVAAADGSRSSHSVTLEQLPRRPSQ